MGENGRKYTEKNHDVKDIADQYEHLFKNLLTNRSKHLKTPIGEPTCTPL